MPIHDSSIYSKWLAESGIRATALAVALLAVSLPAAADTGPCLSGPNSLLVCGTGADALIVLPDTTSPSGKLAVAWRSSSGTSGELPNAQDVQHHLVRLADGKSLGVVVGFGWDTGTAHTNHYALNVAWSPDSRWVLVSDGGKWALEAIAIYSVDEAAGTAAGNNLFRAITDAATRMLKSKVGAKKAESYLLDISFEKKSKVVVANTGAVAIPMVFQVPKEDKDVRLLMRFKASRGKSGVTASPIEVRLVRR